MKLVKYVAGDFDQPCQAPEVPAIIVNTREITHLAGRPEERKMDVADLVIFQPDGSISFRQGIPHASEKIVGKREVKIGNETRKEIHAYFEEYPESKSKTVSTAEFNKLASAVSALTEKVNAIASGQ